MFSYVKLCSWIWKLFHQVRQDFKKKNIFTNDPHSSYELNNSVSNFKTRFFSWGECEILVKIMSHSCDNFRIQLHNITYPMLKTQCVVVGHILQTILQTIYLIVSSAWLLAQLSFVKRLFQKVFHSFCFFNFTGVCFSRINCRLLKSFTTILRSVNRSIRKMVEINI